MEQPRVLPCDVSPREVTNDNIMPTARAASTEQLGASPCHLPSRTTFAGSNIPITRTLSTEQPEALPCHHGSRTAVAGDTVSTTRTAFAQRLSVSPQRLVLRASPKDHVISTTRSASTKHPRVSALHLVSHTTLDGSIVPTTRNDNHNASAFEPSLKTQSRPTTEESLPDLPKKETHYASEINIHSDGRFMSALRAIHSDKGEPVVPKRRSNVDVNTTTEPLSPHKSSPPAAKRRHRRKLQRAHAFMIDRSPSPTGRICEVDSELHPGDDELCALFQNSCGVSDQDE